MNKEQFQTKQAFSLVEVLLALGVIAILILGLAGALAYNTQTSSQVSERTKANFLLEEGLEVTRAIRDANFADLTTGTYGLQFGTSWSLTPTPDVTDGYTRTVAIADVDTNTKQVTVTVEWPGLPAGSNQVSSSQFLTNFNRTVTVTPPVGDWTAPQVLNTVNVSGGNNGFGVVYDSGYIYLLRQNGNPYFIVYDASDLNNLVEVYTELNWQTHNDIDIYNNYIYIGGQESGQQIKIYDVSNKASISQVGTINYNSSGWGAVFDIDIIGDYMYVGKAGAWPGDELLIYDLSIDPTNPTLLGGEDVGGNVWDFYVNGNYVYASTSNGNNEFSIIDISNRSNPQLIYTDNLPGGANGRAVGGYGNYVFFGKNSGNRIFSFDVTNPLSPVLLDTYQPSGRLQNPRDIKVDATNTYIFVGNDRNGSELLVLNATNPSNLTDIGSLSINNDVNDLFYDATLDVLFGVTDGEELFIFEPGP